MHELAPYHRWEKLYKASDDPKSPFFGISPATGEYTNSLYNYYIHPEWDYIGSETLYVKLLFVDYTQRFAIVELLGEWNDILHNDIMFLKREVIDNLLSAGVHKFILIGENVLNFHGLETDYYEEWFEEVEEGWIAAINFRTFIQAEWKKYSLDYYLNFGGELDVVNWRTMQPIDVFNVVDQSLSRRLN